MKYSFLGFSVSKMMELNLDMKDIAILRYFVDFKDTGRMNTEEFQGETYYWINYRSIEEEMPYLGLGKRAIMTRMFKLRDLGILTHYTKKEGGTFSFFALGSKYMELTAINKTSNKDENESKEYDNKNKLIKVKNNLPIIKKNNNSDIREEKEDIKTVKEEVKSKSKEEIIGEAIEGNEEALSYNDKGLLENEGSMFNCEYGVFKNEERVYFENVKGCVSKGRTKTHLLNNSSTKETNNIKKYIKKEIEEIIEYLNSKIKTKYKATSQNTIKLITARFREGFSMEDFKTVIDKKFRTWFGSEFEQYLTPFTLFGSKFEQYLNQKVVCNSTKQKNDYEKKEHQKSNNYQRPKLRFDNFKGREYDYKELERKLLGWD